MLLKMECKNCPLLRFEDETFTNYYCTYNHQIMTDIKGGCDVDSEFLKNEDLATLLEILREELSCCKNRVKKLEKELTKQN